MTTQPATLSPVVPSAALSCIPKALREQLFAALNEVLRNYRERRWEPSELNGGKLCEVVYTILRGHLDGKFPKKAAKPPNMLDACKAFEKADSSKFPRSVRIQIPRVLIALYEIRNNRGVGHVGGDVDPNLMDAIAVVAMSKWTVAELVRVFHAISTHEAQEVVESLVERTLPVVWKVEGAVRLLDAKMTAKDKTLVLLYHAATWVDEETLRSWVEYSNPSMFRDMLLQFHKKKLIEYDSGKRRVILSPTGIDQVETKIAISV